MSDILADKVLDAKGLSCPMPVIKTKKALEGVESGQILEVVATDPASKTDIPALLGRLGHELIEISEGNGEIHYLIRKK